MPSREGRYNIYLPELAEAVTVSLIQAKTEVESAIRPGRTGAVPSVTEPHTAIDPMEARVYNKDMLVVPCTAEATSEVREMIARSERFSNLDNAKIQVAGGAGSEEATLTSRARYYFAGCNWRSAERLGTAASG